MAWVREANRLESCPLEDFSSAPCRENRYLLFLTENYAALEILRHYLSDVVGTSPLSGSLSATPMELEGGTLRPEEMEPLILFGSSFPKDKEYTQVGYTVTI